MRKDEPHLLDILLRLKGSKPLPKDNAEISTAMTVVGLCINGNNELADELAKALTLLIERKPK